MVGIGDGMVYSSAARVGGSGLGGGDGSDDSGIVNITSMCYWNLYRSGVGDTTTTTTTTTTTKNTRSSKVGWCFAISSDEEDETVPNVVEIYEIENCVDDDNKCSFAPVTSAFSTKTTTTQCGSNVVENGTSKGAAGSGPSFLDAPLIGSRDTSAVLCGGSVGGVNNNNRDNNCISSGSGRKSATLATQPDTNLNHLSFLPDTPVVKSPASPATRPRRLFGSATDLRQQNALKELAKPSSNGAGPSLPASRRSSWYDEACSNVVEKTLPSSNDSSVADKDDYAASSSSPPRPRRTFTSVPEDEDAAAGEIAVDGEERVVLLQRSVSVPNNDALSTTPTAAKSKSTSPAPTTTTNNNNGASKLGKWSKSKIDLLLPSLKSLVTMTTNKLSASRPSNLNYPRRSSCISKKYSTSRFDVRTIGSPLVTATLRRNISLNSVQITSSSSSRKNASSDDLLQVCLLNKKLRKCNTVLTLSSSGGCIAKNPNANRTLHVVEPLRPVNRLRVASNSQQDVYTTSRMCSRCSSLLSMASSSRYSLNSAHDFVPVVSPSVPCKVCLNEVPLKDSWTLQHCECSYCVDCVRSYVEFEINQGAYSISCPDAQCEKQGIIMLEEIESLVSLENIVKHKRYRLNKEVEMDKSRTWCPRAGCETVCTLCSTDRCTPQSVHCPTCNMDFCSNCRTSWHAGSPCKSEELVPGVSFDSELIKCCPMCSVPIEKDEGCAQMLCKRCKHVFCWYCLASLDDDFLLRHYDKGPCKNKLGHSRASVIWHRTQVISIFVGFGILLLIASPLLLLAAPCIVCCKCRVCTSDAKLDVDVVDVVDDEIVDAATEPQGNADTADNYIEKDPTSALDGDSS
ncbi:uncharacterized protein LOC135833990 [Planococcus citri]|uniref:uncharacterized protein LOC135833990 n=1 Tax=Planococcus citri TaxID=170843 RepID=UPI0031F7A8D2